MPMIPAKVARIVEARLRDRHILEARAAQALYEAQAKAYAISAPSGSGEGSRGGRKSSRVEAAALKVLQAEDALEAARKWLEVFGMLDRAFPPDSQTARVAERLYRRAMTQKQAMADLGLSEGTVQRCKEEYVCHAALMAAAAGLIKIREDTVNG